MAEGEHIRCQEEDAEPVVNRWILDYYFFLAFQSFEKRQYDDFSAIKLLLDQLLSRPVENTESIPIKIQIIQFLSRINECGKPETNFEPLIPLESALLMLEDMNHGCNMPQQDFKKVATSIKEMMVGISIKNCKFDKAKEMLQKHFPKPVVGKKAIFLGLVKQKRSNHEVIEKINFQEFKEEMVAFCQRLCSFGVPFLYKAAKQLIDKRITEQDNRAATPDEHLELSTPCKENRRTAKLSARHGTVIQRIRLEAAYSALVAGTDQKTLAELENELETEQQDREFCLQLSPESQGHHNVDSGDLCQRNSGSPMEASPADQTEQTNVTTETQASSKMPPVLQIRKPFSMARLVVEPDSQPRSYSTVASQEIEADVRIENPTQPQTASKTVQGPGQDGETILTPQKSTKSKGRKRHGGGSNRTPTSSTAHLPDKDGSSVDSDTNKEECGRLGDSGLVERLPAGGETEQQALDASPETPKPKIRNQSTRTTPRMDTSTTDDMYISDSSLDGSPALVQHSGLISPKSSTPQKYTTEKKEQPSYSKWKSLYNNAKESKEIWSDEETYFACKTNKRENESTVTESENKRKKWTESETQKLKDGVKRFGEGNWSKIKVFYSFHDRTNINLKDRWRTMLKNKLV